MAARSGATATGLLSGLAALALHAAVWSALERAPAESEAQHAQPPALVWLENPTVLTANADTDGDTRQRVAPPTVQARVRPRTATRSAARACASVPAATSSLDALPLPTEAHADGSAIGTAEQPGSAVAAIAAASAVAPGAASGREGAPAPRARLLSNHPCAGDFPGGAGVDVGEVQVDVAVDASGHAALSSVLLERPAGQGFAQAAQACARKLLFAPAHDGSGAAVPVHAKLRLMFKRS